MNTFAGSSNRIQGTELTRWWDALIPRAAKVSKLHASNHSVNDNYLRAPSGISGLIFVYKVTTNNSSAELFIERQSRQECLRILKQLETRKEHIEKEFGAPLIWDPMKEGQSCRITYTIRGGYRSAEENWPEIQNKIIDAMARLEKTLRPRITEFR